jgi:3-dehydroquinate dehydratase/shikimate dehydrogenase
MSRASLIATLTQIPSASGAELSALSASVDWLEVRADLVGDLDPKWLRSHFKGRLLYSLRSSSAGAFQSESSVERQARLRAAAQRYDQVELEGEQDSSPELLAQIPSERRLLSWYGRADNLSTLQARFEKLSSIPAGRYKIVVTAESTRDEFVPLELLKSLGRNDTIAYATGWLGFWTRLLALQLGAPAIYGLVPPGNAEEPHEPTVNKLIDDYGLPAVSPTTQLFAIVGDPIFHSLSPRLHNAAYRALNYPALFVPLRVKSFDEFWQAICSHVLDSLGFPIDGMTVASPHKEIALQIAKVVSPMARKAESANILVRNNGWWNADTTDPEVVYMASRERSVELKQKRAAVIGCGGAGRAIAAALAQSGAGVMLINRGETRGHHAAELLGLPYTSLLDFEAEGYDLVVNATPVGRDTDEVPFEVEKLSDDAVVIDLVYGSRPTPLVDSTLAREQIVIDGRDVLLTQVLHQFHLMTGKKMSPALALEKLGQPAGTQKVGHHLEAPLEPTATATTDTN